MNNHDCGLFLLYCQGKTVTIFNLFPKDSLHLK